MAKYLTEFNTYAEYQAATLNLPNVSLIKSTGKVYYKNIFAGATLGDILMWDNVNNKLVTTFGGNWDSTTYPIAQYEPIAINIYPSSQASDGKSRYMALRWLDSTNNTGNKDATNMKWGLQVSNTSTDQTALNGRENTNIILNISGFETDYIIFKAANEFITSGTSAGDWYVPSKGELSLYQSNYADINAKIETIKNASSSIVNTVNWSQWSSTEYGNSNFAFNLDNNGSWNYRNKSNSYGVRGMIAL